MSLGDRFIFVLYMCVTSKNSLNFSCLYVSSLKVRVCVFFFFSFVSVCQYGGQRTIWESILSSVALGIGLRLPGLRGKCFCSFLSLDFHSL